MGDKASTTGKLPARLANAVSDAIHAAIASGMEPDEATCIAAAVVADYGRSYYGDECLPHLSAAIAERAKKPNPTTV